MYDGYHSWGSRYSSGAGRSGRHNNAVEEGQVLLPAADATFTEGEGVGPDNEKEPTSYDEETGMIRAAAQGTEIVYTVPEGTEGTFDLYLTVSKVLAAFSSQPFTFTINDGETFSVSVDLQVTGRFTSFL